MATSKSSGESPLHETVLPEYDHNDCRSNTNKEIQHALLARTSFLGSSLNGLNALSGIGILSVPYALSEGGWLSLILLFMMAIIFCYTGLLLTRCMDASPNITSYSDIGELAFGYKGRVIISIFIYLELYLVATEFIMLEGDNLYKLFPNMHFKVFELQIAGKQCFIIMATLIILPTTWLKSLNLLAYISAGGILALGIVMGSVLWVSTIDGVGFHGKGNLLNFSGLPISVSIYSFCYSGHPIFPTIYTSMRDKKQFSKVLVLCFIFSTLNYGTLAVIGYLMYGKDLQSQITLNLPLGKISSTFAIVATIINPFARYALVIMPVANAIEERFQISRRHAICILIRTLLVISTAAVALTIPFFAYLMALIGSFLNTMVSMVIPCICYSKIFKPSNKLTLVTIGGILMVGVTIVVIGTWTSLRQIVQHL